MQWRCEAPSAATDHCDIAVSMNFVFVDLSVLHDHHKVLRRIGDKVEVLQRITVHQDQVGQRAFLHHTELARVGVARTTHFEELGIIVGGHFQSFIGCVPLFHLGQEFPLFLGEGGVEQEIGAEGGLDLVLLGARRLYPGQQHTPRTWPC
jgi:hypothetical protein